MLLYQMHELGRAWMAPWTYWAEANAKMFSAPGSWLSTLPGADAHRRRLRAGAPHRQGLREAAVRHPLSRDRRRARCPVVEREMLRKPFCRLLRFKRYTDDAGKHRGD